MKTRSVDVQIAYGNLEVAVMVVALARCIGGAEAIPDDWEAAFQKSSGINACFGSTEQAEKFQAAVEQYLPLHTRLPHKSTGE